VKWVPQQSKARRKRRANARRFLHPERKNGAQRIFLARFAFHDNSPPFHKKSSTISQ